MSEYRPQVDTREHLKGMIQRSDPQSAEARIRELETTRQCEADYFHNELKELRGRIAKAREILEVTALDSESSWARTKAKEALDALERK